MSQDGFTSGATAAENTEVREVKNRTWLLEQRTRSNAVRRRI